MSHRAVSLPLASVNSTCFSHYGSLKNDWNIPLIHKQMQNKPDLWVIKRLSPTGRCWTNSTVSTTQVGTGANNWQHVWVIEEIVCLADAENSGLFLLAFPHVLPSILSPYPAQTIYQMSPPSIFAKQNTFGTRPLSPHVNIYTLPSSISTMRMFRGISPGERITCLAVFYYTQANISVVTAASVHLS